MQASALMATGRFSFAVGTTLLKLKFATRTRLSPFAKPQVSTLPGVVIELLGKFQPFIMYPTLPVAFRIVSPRYVPIDFPS